MSARFLAWYTSVVLLFATLAASAITWAPGLASSGLTLVALGCIACLFVGLAILLTVLPREHWSNRSHAVRGALAVPALCASLLLFISVG